MARQKVRRKSVRSALRELGLEETGQNRKLLNDFIDDALFRLWEKACNDHGAEFAACLMAWMVTRDSRYKPQLWLQLVFKRHAQAVAECLTMPGINASI